MIEPASVAHAQALAVIHAAAFCGGECWSAAAIAVQITQPGAYGFIAVADGAVADGAVADGAVADGAMAGGLVLARVAADEAEVLTLGVAPSARRCGLGRALLERAMAAAAARGAVSMVLEVAAANEAARALYGAVGFVAVGNRRTYYPNGDDALILRAALTL